MKKIISLILICFTVISFTACGCRGCKAIELMGAGDRIHGAYTFSNIGVEINEIDDNTYEISGSVEKLDSKSVKEEFSIASDVTHIVAIKLTAIDSEVESEEVEITVNNIRAYDAEHLNGSDYTFIILEAKPDTSAEIKVKWNKEDKEKIYQVKFDKDLVLK